MFRLGVFFSLLAVLLMQGCASMSQQECMVADWRTVGFEDGVRGAKADTIGTYRKACADHGVAPDLRAYRAGRADGLRQYCTVQNGFNVGAQGARYHGVCPPELELEFMDAFRAGRKLHDLEAAVRSVNQKIYHREAEIDNLRTELVAKEAALISGETSSEERVQLLVEIRDMAHQQGELEEEIVVLERDMAVLERELASYRAHLAYDY